MHKGNKTLIAVVKDLLFSAKITEAAKRTGLTLHYATTESEVLERVKERPTLIIMDLNLEAAHPLRLIQKLKSSPETKGISIIGYLPHVQADLKLKAQQAGCDMVMPRSAFSMNLVQILKRHAGIV